MSVAEFLSVANGIKMGGPLKFSNLLTPINIDGISVANLNEQLNEKLKEKLGDYDGAHKFVDGYAVRGLTLLGDASYAVMKLIRKSPLAGDLHIAGLARTPYVTLPSLFRLRFLKSDMNLAYAHSKVQEIFGLKEASYPASIGAQRMRLYFSDELRPPICINRNKGCQYLALGELALPYSMCGLFYQNCGEPPRDLDEAFELAKGTGHLHPNYAFTLPSSEVRAAVLKGGFDFNPQLIVYFALNGVEMKVKEDRVELIEGEMLKVLTSYVNGELSGVTVPEPAKPPVRIRPNPPLPEEREEAMGIMPEGPVNINYCERCRRDTPFKICEACGGTTRPLMECPRCGIETVEERCPRCGGDTRPVVSRRYNLNEILSAAATSLGLTVNLSDLPSIRSNKAFEPAQKAVLRRFFSVHCDSDGVHKVPIRVEAADVSAGEIILPYRTASSLIDVARFIDSELRLIFNEKTLFSKYEPEALVGSRVVLMHRRLRYGVELVVSGLRNEFEALVNPGTMSAIFDGFLFNVGYVALSADVGLNYLGPYPMVIFHSTTPETLAIKPSMAKSSYVLQGFVELEKGLLDGMSKLAPEVISINEIITHANEIELAYSTQRHVCEKCGKRYSVPPLNYRCSRCGSKLRPSYYTADLSTMIAMLGNIASNSAADDEFVQLYIGKLQAMIKSSTQMSLSEF